MAIAGRDNIEKPGSSEVNISWTPSRSSIARRKKLLVAAQCPGRRGRIAMLSLQRQKLRHTILAKLRQRRLSRRTNFSKRDEDTTSSTNGKLKSTKVTFSTDTKKRDGMTVANTLLDDLVWKYFENEIKTVDDVLLCLRITQKNRNERFSTLVSVYSMVGNIIYRLNQKKNDVNAKTPVLPKGGGKLILLGHENRQEIKSLAFLVESSVRKILEIHSINSSGSTKCKTNSRQSSSTSTIKTQNTQNSSSSSRRHHTELKYLDTKDTENLMKKNILSNSKCTKRIQHISSSNSTELSSSTDILTNIPAKVTVY